jgi:hypothetical protein
MCLGFADFGDTLSLLPLTFDRNLTDGISYAYAHTLSVMAKLKCLARAK